MARLYQKINNEAVPLGGGGGGSVAIDNDTITKNSDDEIQVAPALTGKINQLNNVTADMGKVLTANGDGTAEWDDILVPIDYETITKNSNGELQVSSVPYDNTDSGLEADNVQDAIDELNSNLGMVKEQCSGANFINNPYVYKNGQFCVVSLAAQLKAGSYASLQSLAQLPFTPAGTFITIAMFGGSTTPIRVDTNGAISFNETHNVSSPDWIIGELAYISEN